MTYVVELKNKVLFLNSTEQVSDLLELCSESKSYTEWFQQSGKMADNEDEIILKIQVDC